MTKSCNKVSLEGPLAITSILSRLEDFRDGNKRQVQNRGKADPMSGRSKISKGLRTQKKRQVLGTMGIVNRGARDE
jgi:hypothetical protein